MYYRQVEDPATTTTTTTAAADLHHRSNTNNKTNVNEGDGIMLEGAAPAIRQKKTMHETFRTIAGIAGNVLEWYDFAVFGYFSDIIADQFFPNQQDDSNSALVASFAVFGGAFMMRPIGGLLFGYIGDVYGRKQALQLSIMLMAIPTFCMGCLPTYSQVGWVSIFLLVIVRLLQGLSVGGQLMSSLVFTLEGHDKSQWGLYGSYVMASANFGTLLGGLVAWLLREILTEDQLAKYGWRIPFWSGLLVSIAGIYLKFHCEEEELAHLHGANNEAGPHNPLKKAFAKENRRSLAAASLVPALWSGGFYLAFVWMAVFMNTLVDPAVPNAFGVNSAALFFSVCLLFPGAGILSDKYGRKPIMAAGGVAMGILSPVMLWAISQGNSWGAFFAQSTLGIALSFWGAPLMAWLVESFRPEIRLTSVSIGYNIAQALVGGSTPALATLMADRIGDVAPAFLLSFIAILSLTGLLCVAPPPPEHVELGTGDAASSSSNAEADLGDVEVV